jgi:hypothetical protein
MSIESQRKVASSVSSRLSGISAVLFVAVLFVAATQVRAGQTIIGSKRNHGFDIILLDSEVLPREPLVSRRCGYPIPPSASLPESRQLLPFPSPHREVNKAIYLLATLLLPVWLIYGRHTVKWIEPIERFVDAIVLLWLFDIVFKSVSRSSQRLTKA